MALPTLEKLGIPDEGVKLEKHLGKDIIYVPAPYISGVRLKVYPATISPNTSVEVHWAPDSGGSPDTANEKAFVTLPPGEQIAFFAAPVDNVYRWFRARHVGGIYGYLGVVYSDWVKAKPVWDGTGVIYTPIDVPLGTGEVATGNINNSAVTTPKLADGAVTTIKFATGLTPIEIVTSLPATGNYEGRMVYLTTDDKLYRHTGAPADATGFIKAVDGADLVALSVTTNAIFTGAVTSAKIAVTQLDAITANMGTLTAGLIRDGASKFFIDLSSRLITMIDEQAGPGPYTRVLIGEVGGALNGWGIELRDAANAIVMKTHGARSNTMLSLYTVAGGTLTVNDEGAAELQFQRTAGGLVATMSSDNVRVEIYHATSGSKVHIGGTAYGITAIPVASQHFTISTSTGQLVLTDTTKASIIRTATSDGSDDNQLVVTAGGSVSFNRGGFIALYGNEHANAGMVVIGATVTGAAVGFFKVQVGSGNDVAKFEQSAITLYKNTIFTGDISFMTDTTPTLSSGYNFSIAANGNTVVFTNTGIAISNEVTAINSNLSINAGAPKLLFYEGGQGADGKAWDIVVDGGLMYFRVTEDDDATQYAWLTVTRTGVTYASVKLDNLVVGAPTGGNLGQGLINAVGVYDNGTLLTDYVFEKYWLGAVKDRKHRAYTMLSLKQAVAYTKRELHLPTMIGRDQFQAFKGRSVGQLVTQLWETAETHFLYLAEHDDEITKLKSKVKKLERKIVALERAA